MPARARAREINLDRSSHLGRQFPLLPLERLHQLLVPPIALFPAQLLRRYRLAAAALRMGVVRRPARALLRVLLLPPLGPAVLEPHLKHTYRRPCLLMERPPGDCASNTQREPSGERKSACCLFSEIIEIAEVATARRARCHGTVLRGNSRARTFSLANESPYNLLEFPE